MTTISDFVIFCRLVGRPRYSLYDRLRFTRTLYMLTVPLQIALIVRHIDLCRP